VRKDGEGGWERTSSKRGGEVEGKELVHSSSTLLDLVLRPYILSIA